MTLRAGVIGLGVMGRHHCRVLSELGGVDFVGVADPYANPLPGYQLFREIDDLLDAGVDYCVLAAPTSAHYEIGLQLATKGIHTLIEKPLAESVNQSSELVNSFESAGLICGVGHIERYNPAIAELRKRIDDGLLGEVLQVSTRRQGPFPGRIADVGVIKDLATHDIHIAMWLTRSTFSSFTGHVRHLAGRDYEDMLVAIGELNCGAMSNHVVNWLSPFKERQTVVIGEKGSLVADTLNAQLTFHANGKVTSNWEQLANFRGVSVGDTTTFAIDTYEPLRLEHEAFRNAVLGDDSIGIVSAREGLEVVRIATSVIQGKSV